MAFSQQGYCKTQWCTGSNQEAVPSLERFSFLFFLFLAVFTTRHACPWAANCVCPAVVQAAGGGPALTVMSGSGNKSPGTICGSNVPPHVVQLPHVQ